MKVKFELHEKVGRDQTFTMLLRGKYCLFGFDEDDASKLDIHILCANGDLHWTKLDKPEVPDKLLVSRKKDLINVGKSWLRNYSGSY